MAFDVDALRTEFPTLGQKPYGKPLVYLDNAATTQKPQVVIDAIERYYREQNSNVHRGAHYLGDVATHAMEEARATVASFLNASREEVIWTKGTTDALNLVAHSLGSHVLSAGDEVLISTLEHHANIVPWQQICTLTGASIKVIPLKTDGTLALEQLENLLTERTKIVAVAHASNALGTINDIAALVQKARQIGAYVVVDGAQAVSHFPVDVKQLDCDFYAFSGHKVFGPTGIGVLYGKRELLEAIPPYQTGGEMIETVSFETSTWNRLPYKFEAGTPHIAGAIGLGAALTWLMQQDRQALWEHESALLAHATEHARAFAGMRIIGDNNSKVGVLSFLIEGTHPSDVGTLLDQQGIAVRTGHHCTMPLMDSLGIPGTVRAAFAPYNTLEDVDALFTGLHKIMNFL